MSDPLVRRVLIPLDGSPTAESILPLLRQFQSEGVSSTTLTRALEDGEGREEAEHYLRSKAFQLTCEGIPSTYALRHGSAAAMILKVATEVRSTMIALATHGRTGLDRWVTGSVAEEVLRCSPLPVLLTRSVGSTGRKISAPTLRSILVPLDGSPESLGILEPTIALAKGIDARVRLLHVDEPSPAPGHWDLRDDVVRRADQILRDACIPTTFEQRRGRPAEEILHCAEDQNVDLIAMTTHGRSGPSRWLLGSVTAEVLRHAPVPMLTIRRTTRMAGNEAGVENKTTHPEDIPAFFGSRNGP